MSAPARIALCSLEDMQGVGTVVSRAACRDTITWRRVDTVSGVRMEEG